MYYIFCVFPFENYIKIYLLPRQFAKWMAVAIILVHFILYIVQEARQTLSCPYVIELVYVECSFTFNIFKMSCFAHSPLRMQKNTVVSDLPNMHTQFLKSRSSRVGGVLLQTRWLENVIHKRLTLCDINSQIGP